MEIKFKDTKVESIKTDLLVVPVREKPLEEPAVRALDRRLKGRLRERIQKSKFSGAEASTLLYATAGSLPAAQLLLFGIGNGNDADSWRKAAARARKEASAIGAEEIALFFAAEKEPDKAAGAIVEGVSLASYQFNKYRSSSSQPAELKSLTRYARRKRRFRAFFSPAISSTNRRRSPPPVSSANRRNVTAAAAAYPWRSGERIKSRRCGSPAFWP